MSSSSSSCTTTSLPPTNPRSKALNLLSGFATLSSTQLFADRSATCRWHMLPHTLGFDPAGYDNAQHKTHLAGAQRLLSAFPVTPLDTIVAETVTDDTTTTTTTNSNGNSNNAKKRRVVVSVHAEGEAVLRPEILALLQKDTDEGGGKRLLEEAKGEPRGLGMGKQGGIRNEYYFVFYFDEQGDKIEKVVEWLDAGLTRRLMGLMGRAGALVAAAAKEVEGT